MVELKLRPLNVLQGECPLYAGVGVNRHRWVTDVTPTEESRRGKIVFYVENGYEGWDPIAPEVAPTDVFCRYCGILAASR